MKEKITMRPSPHQEHREWFSQLDFYSDELRVFELELQKVIQEHPDLLSIIEHVDEYREILDRKKLHIQDMEARIVDHEQRMGINPAPSGEEENVHQVLKSELSDFQKSMEDLKRSFRRFVAYND
ncbi:MAG: hypothetical protein IPH16_13500 [Haliscomenobacter sp.]|nr:hypothetical protein [Haliscomenobacter sp.]MBK7477336.1 hypothetical protein [Haliscomenobacter sp.]MBK8880066.1 hypothetical protein [Haliscomenobacter sp.]